ncbi:MAG: OmpA family protein [Candidatus Fermentibacteria bacterium]
MNTKLMTILTASILIAAVMSGSGCRPDETLPDDPDTTTVVVIDEFPDTLVGVWETDTLSTSTDMLLIHQDHLNDVFFDYDSDALSGDALNILMEDASYIMETEGFRVLLEGHCDERGTIDYNLALGENRALAVYNYLVNYGVDASRLEYVSYGKERPFDPAHTEQAWGLNRRAHFRVLPGN